ncbi:MAG TPA: hypothetical protein DD458_13480 [Prolixibacteraceae bacterium]|nr:hypothetical protein [Prolixibacteraceae bacterium]HCR89284.1 hypothetical protein [Prolixibacteraceae bacterium]HCU60468.1 hypothetical protein [Prolixibacteraceae bacterium]
MFRLSGADSIRIQILKNNIKKKAMEDKTTTIETLLERAADYGKTSYELVKLKAIEKTSDIISSLLSQSVVLIMLLSCMLFLNVGLAFWLGQILGEIYFGFFIVAGFYAIAVVVIHFFMRKWLKKQIGNTFIKQLLK